MWNKKAKHKVSLRATNTRYDYSTKGTHGDTHSQLTGHTEAVVGVGHSG